MAVRVHGGGIQRLYGWVGFVLKKTRGMGVSSDVAIEVSRLSKSYQIYNRPGDRFKQMVLPRIRRLFSRKAKNYFTEFQALKDISFCVERGEAVGILGRNGSGKSTLLQIIAGTLSPTSGNVVANGRLTALLELGSGFNPEFSGRENVYMNGVILGLTKEEIDQKFEEIVDFADIGEHIDQPVKTYSSGMVVRLAFAVQACVDPQILIIDEALSVGDEKFQRKCFDYIERLRRDGCSILLVTHSTATVEKFCQRGVLLHHGEVRAIGSAKDVVDQYHALLYADERAAMDALERSHVSGGDNPLVNPKTSREAVGRKPNPSDLRKAASIEYWEVLDEDGNGCAAFQAGDQVILRMMVRLFCDIPELQAGFLLRTIEGVSVFGTSTLYRDRNIKDVHAGEKYRFDFKVQLNLSPGSYFVTFAVAQAISEADMRYLDRKADALIIKVTQIRVEGTGICVLPTSISVHRESQA